MSDRNETEHRPSYDWHDSSCGGSETSGFDGKPLTLPCDCEMPRLFAAAFRDGLAEAKRRLSVVGMHSGNCQEPDKPCTCGLDAAIDNPNPVPWNKPEIEQ